MAIYFGFPNNLINLQLILYTQERTTMCCTCRSSISCQKYHLVITFHIQASKHRQQEDAFVRSVVKLQSTPEQCPLVIKMCNYTKQRNEHIDVHKTRR